MSVEKDGFMCCGSCYRDGGVSQLLLPWDSSFLFLCGCGCGSCLPSDEEVHSLAQELVCIDEVVEGEEGHGYEADNYHEFLCRVKERKDMAEANGYSEFSVVFCTKESKEQKERKEIYKADDYREFLRCLLYEGEERAEGEEGDRL